MAKVKVNKPSGDPEPKKSTTKPTSEKAKETSRAVFKTRAEINAANEKARAMAARSIPRGSEISESDIYVARDIGDPVPDYYDMSGNLITGKPAAATKIGVSILPNGITFEDVYASKDGGHYFNHPNTGNATLVNYPDIVSKYGNRKKAPEVAAELAQRKIGNTLVRLKK